MTNVKKVFGAAAVAAAFGFSASAEAGSHGYPAGVLKDYRAFTTQADPRVMQIPAMKAQTDRLAALTRDYRDGIYKVDPKDIPAKDRVQFHVDRLTDYNNIVATLVRIREAYAAQRPNDQKALKFLAHVDVYPCRDQTGTMNVLATLQSVLPKLPGAFRDDSYVLGKVTHIQDMARQEMGRPTNLSEAFGSMIVNSEPRRTVGETVAAGLMLSAYADQYTDSGADRVPAELKDMHRRDPAVCTVPGQRI